MSNLLEDIKDARDHLEKLERQYVRETEPCHNTKCGFYRETNSLNCCWTTLVEDCEDYSSEED